MSFKPLLLLIFFISSCSSDNNNANIDYSLRSDSVLYNEALSALKKKDYLVAHELFT